MACAAHRDPCTTNAFIGDYFGLAISEENVYALFVSTHCPSDVIGDDGGPVYYQQQVLATVARSDLGSPRLATDLVTRSVTIPGRRPHTAGLRFPKRWRSVSTQWLSRSALGVFGCRRRDKDGAEQIVVESAERGACAAQSRIEGRQQLMPHRVVGDNAADVPVGQRSPAVGETVHEPVSPRDHARALRGVRGVVDRRVHAGQIGEPGIERPEEAPCGKQP
jgi:hypothetical protein